MNRWRPTDLTGLTYSRRHQVRDMFLGTLLWAIWLAMMGPILQSLGFLFVEVEVSYGHPSLDERKIEIIVFAWRMGLILFLLTSCFGLYALFKLVPEQGRAEQPIALSIDEEADLYDKEIRDIRRLRDARESQVEWDQGGLISISAKMSGDS